MSLLVFSLCSFLDNTCRFFTQCRPPSIKGILWSTSSPRVLAQAYTPTKSESEQQVHVCLILLISLDRWCAVYSARFFFFMFRRDGSVRYLRLSRALNNSIFLLRAALTFSRAQARHQRQGYPYLLTVWLNSPTCPRMQTLASPRNLLIERAAFLTCVPSFILPRSTVAFSRAQARHHLASLPELSVRCPNSSTCPRLQISDTEHIPAAW